MDDTVTESLSGEDALIRHIALQQEEIERSPVTRVPIDSLVTSGSPRLAGEDEEHVRRLAESGAALPPITVHLPSRQVIDGMHRVRAAILRGEKDISARFFQGGEVDVFLLSVAANVRHGLPLSHQDRTAAAERIFALHPEWSDRMVAQVVGVSHKKIAALRARIAADLPRAMVRIGRDGKSRPVDGAARRRRAAQLLTGDPDASLRRIAREAGISPATAADVRDRVRRGEDPVPRRHAMEPAAPLHEEPLTIPGDHSCGESKLPSQQPVADVLPMLTARFERLRKDPSLRFTEIGRTVLRMCDACQAVIRHQDAIKNALPAHRLPMTVELFQIYANMLQSLAAELLKSQTSESVEDDDFVEG
jgi:ParB-like chromosome segregation protein Spo0J